MDETKIIELWTNILEHKDEILQNDKIYNTLLCNKNKNILDIIHNNNMEFDAETYVMVAFLIHMLFVFSFMVHTVNQ